MLKQNYINIFENAGGNVTVAYATCSEDALQMENVQSVSIESDDLYTISEALKGIAESLSNEG